MFQDGFGQRSGAVDPDTGDPVEILAFTPGLATAPGFGEAVGERVARLARVRHAMYARVRKIDRPSPDEVLLYSDAVDGWRLADVLTTAEREGVPLDIGAVLVLLRQLLAAVTLFSRHQRDAAIGTIGPERLLLTRQARLVVAEYVLAPGLEQVQYPRERLWRELRVAMPPTSNPGRIPPSADVVGIGVVALSLLLGRVLKEDEYLVSLGELVDSVGEVSAGTTRQLSAGFSVWLGRALQFDEHNAFRSTHEAQMSFEEMLAKERSYVTTSAPLDLFVEKLDALLAHPAPSRTPAAPLTVAASTVAPAAAAPAVAAATAAPVAPAAPLAPAAYVAPLASAAPLPTLTPSDAASAPDASVAAALPELERLLASTAPDATPAAAGEPSSWTRGRRALPAAAIALVVIQAALIAWLVSRDAPTLSDSGELVVHSRPVAARVSVDGEERGITPLTTELTPGPHVLEIRVGKSEPRVIPIVIRSGVQSGIYVELQSVATVGGLEVRSAPAAARVTVAGQFRGTTPVVVKDLPPGDVEVLVQSAARQVRQLVRIEPGITSQLVVPLDR